MVETFIPNLSALFFSCSRFTFRSNNTFILFAVIKGSKCTFVNTYSSFTVCSSACWENRWRINYFKSRRLCFYWVFQSDQVMTKNMSIGLKPWNVKKATDSFWRCTVFRWNMSSRGSGKSESRAATDLEMNRSLQAVNQTWRTEAKSDCWKVFALFSVDLHVCVFTHTQTNLPILLST